jgi:hypothetical protein
MSGARGRKQTGGGSGCAGAILGMSAQGIVLGRVSEWACGRKGGRTQWDEMNVRGEKPRHSRLCTGAILGMSAQGTVRVCT